VARKRALLETTLDTRKGCRCVTTAQPRVPAPTGFISSQRRGHLELLNRVPGSSHTSKRRALTNSGRAVEVIDCNLIGEPAFSMRSSRGSFSRYSETLLPPFEAMPSSNWYCLRCQQPITEIDPDSEALKGCRHCNIWWVFGSIPRPRLSQGWGDLNLADVSRCAKRVFHCTDTPRATLWPEVTSNVVKLLERRQRPRVNLSTPTTCR